MITYTGETDVREKISELIDEMCADQDLNFTIQIYESRENEKISKLMIEVIDIKNSIPDF